MQRAFAPFGNQGQPSVMGMSVRGGGRGEHKNFDLKLTLTIFLRQICEFHKTIICI